MILKPLLVSLLLATFGFEIAHSSPLNCYRNARIQWEQDGGGISDVALAAELCTGATSNAPVRCYRNARILWSHGGGGVGRDDSWLAVELCKYAESQAPFQCFRRARTVWEDEGGDLSTRLSVLLCREAKDNSPLNCFRRARMLWRNGGGGIGIGDEEYAVRLCATEIDRPFVLDPSQN